MSILWQSMTIATAWDFVRKLSGPEVIRAGGGHLRLDLQTLICCLRQKLCISVPCLNTRDFILWPWFVSFCIQNWVISRAIMGFMALGSFSSNRHGIGFLRYWNVNTVYRQPSHSLKRLRSVQKGTLFKTPNSENVSTPCLRLKPLKIIPCSAVHTRKSQIRKCPPPSPRELILAKAIHN